MKSQKYGSSVGAAAGSPPPSQVAAQQGVAEKPGPKNPELEKYDQYGNTSITEAAYNGNFKKIQGLVSEGADIDARTGDEHKDTSLHKAVTGKKPVETTRCLLELKADVNVVNATGQTAAHYAAYHGNLPVLELLVQAKANVNARENNYGDDLAHKAVASKQSDATKISLLEFLKSHGAIHYYNDDNKDLHDYAEGNHELNKAITKIWPIGAVEFPEE